MHRVSPVARTGRTAELLATGSVCVLLANPAAAVELGDIEIHSALGQPLRASIAFALGPNERLADDCVYLRAAAPAAGLPTVTRASATVNGRRLVLRGNTPLREPMMSLQVVVDCPYTARLRRDYLLLLNPPELAAAMNRSEPEPAPRVAPASPPVPAAPRAERRRRAVATTPIAAGQDYRVQPGDTLSGIASRIEDRSVGLWPAIERIFAANPAAFPGGDIDRLMAGTTLRIPPSLAANPAPAAATAPAAASGAAYPAAGSMPGAANSERRPPRIEDAAAAPAGAVPQPSAALAASDAVTPPETAPDSGDGDRAAGEPTASAVPAAAPRRDAGERRAATGSAPEPAAPPTVLEAAAPQREIAAGTPRGEPIPLAGDADSPAQSWLVWLGGGGIAIFLALLIFGRRLRERFDGGAALDAGRDPQEAAPGEAPRGRRSTDRRGAGHEGVSDDDTDFDTGEDMDVALDYSFASSADFSSELDFIVEESQITSFPPEDIGTAQDDDLAPTREMPARQAGDTTEDIAAVTDRFPPPGKRPKDLETIEVEALDSRPRPGHGLDLTSEFDYEVLEQDYEEELTATHALSLDIEQAARDLQRELGEVDDVTDINEMPTSRRPDSDETVEMDTDATVEHRSKTG